MAGRMANKRKVGNLLALAVLAYLSRAPMHPYELSRTLRDNGDARSIKFNHGSLYMVVQLLHRGIELVAEQQTEIGARIDGAVAQDVHRLFLIEEEDRLAMLTAEISFVERFIDQITHPDTGWGRMWAQFHGEPAPT